MSVKGNEQGYFRDLKPSEKRERIKTYGKWYLKPNNFNKRNELTEREKEMLVVGADKVREDEVESLLYDKKRKKEVSKWL